MEGFVSGRREELFRVASREYEATSAHRHRGIAPTIVSSHSRRFDRFAFCSKVEAWTAGTVFSCAVVSSKPAGIADSSPFVQLAGGVVE